jgi:acetoin utilization deacetylase AcuC-like enzyme
VPLRPGAGDGEILQAYRQTFREDCAAFRPDCCLVSAGYDLHAGDPLADLEVSDEGVRGIVRSILDACAGVPVVFTLEGGYHPATLARCVGITLQELLLR